MRGRKALIALLIVLRAVACTAQDVDTLSPELLLLSNRIARIAASSGYQEPAVIVNNFVDPHSLYSDFGRFVADKVSEYLSGTPGLRVLNRHSLEVILDEISLEVSGLVNADDQHRIGEFTGASLIITGSIVDVDAGLEVIAEITDVSSAEYRTVSHRIPKTEANMRIISAISDAESEQRQALSGVLDDIVRAIRERQAELQALYSEGLHDVETRIAEREAVLRERLAIVEEELVAKSIVLAELESREAALSRVESEIEAVRDRIRRLNFDLGEHLYVGMTATEFERIFDVSMRTQDQYEYIRTFGTSAASVHGKWTVLWSSHHHPREDLGGGGGSYTTRIPIVIAWIDRTTGDVYRRNP